MQNVTYNEVKHMFQSIAGLDTLTSADEFFLTNSLNRSALNAYHKSNLWPRFLVVGEERTVTDSAVPYSQATKNDIGEFVHIHKTEPYGTNYAKEYDFYVDSVEANIVDIDAGLTAAYVTYKKAFNPAYDEDSTDIPQEFLDYMIHIALSDFYTGDGQTENAVINKKIASEHLEDELFRLQQKSNSNRLGIKFRSHLTNQRR